LVSYNHNAVQNCLSIENRSISDLHVGLGKELLTAAKENTPQKFRSLLKQVVQQYRGDKEGFLKVLNTRDEDDFNIMQFGSLISDIENVSAIFDALEEFYGNDTYGLFEYLSQRTKQGLTILGLAEYSANRRLIELIMMRIMKLSAENKELFLKFMNLGTYQENERPLGDASFDSEFENIKIMVKVAAHVLGRDSKEFDEFLNAQEKSGNNALSYAKDNQIKFFLMHYGAKMPIGPIDPLITKANQEGLALNHAINHDQFKKFNKILNLASQFKDNDYALFTFFSTRNSAGWNPFINVAADNQINYLKILLEKIDYLFKEDKETKSLLLSNADFEGRTPLHLAILRRNFDIARLLIDTIVRYSVNKPFLYAVLSVANELNGFTPFTNTIYASEDFDEEIYEFTKFFITRAEQLFGRNSRMFYLFMNTRDYNGWNPLAYAVDTPMIKLLKSYGAVDTVMPYYKGIGEFKKLEFEGEL
jgi:ankyrin repeat protein